MKEQIIGLGSLFLILSGMLLRSTAKVAITMIVLWLIGKSFPIVADALGLPYSTLYAFFMELYAGLLLSVRYVLGQM